MRKDLAKEKIFFFFKITTNAKSCLDANYNKNTNPWLSPSLRSKLQFNTHFERRHSNRLNLRECCPFHCASPKWLQTRNLNTYRLICGSKDEHLLLFPQYSCVAAGIKSFFPWTIKKFELGNVAHFYIDFHYSLKAKIKVFQQDPYPNVT